MFRPKYFLILLISLLFTSSLYAQFHFRIECDISVKTKLADGTSSLTMGKAYFDQKINKLVFDIKFPKKEVWIIKDTTLFTIANNKVIKKEKTLPLAQYTIFNIVLNGSLESFGLKNSIYNATKVESDKGLVITTYTPPDKLKDQVGKIMISTKNKELFGVVIFDSDNNIVSKQQYKTYQTVKGLKVPGEIIQVMYNNGKESYQVISFKNVKINNLANENFYNYPISVSK